MVDTVKFGMNCGGKIGRFSTNQPETIIGLNLARGVSGLREKHKPRHGKSTPLKPARAIAEAEKVKKLVCGTAL